MHFAADGHEHKCKSLLPSTSRVPQQVVYLMSGEGYEVVRAVIVGAGSSSSTPKVGCVVSHADCCSCKAATLDPRSKSHRLNPSFLLQLRQRAYQEDVQTTRAGPDNLINILVDCGKTFRESAIKVLAPLRITALHGILLTHPHADAILGLDDLREFGNPQSPTPVYLDAATEVQLRKTFNYLFPSPEASAKKLWVASVDWRPMFEGAPWRSKGELLGGVLDVTMPAPNQRKHATPQCEDAETTLADASSASWPISVFQVWHGVDTVSNAFVFPLPLTDADAHCKVILYLSDISVVNDETIATFRRHIELLHARMSPPQNAAVPLPSFDNDEAFLHRFVQVAIVDMLSEEPYISHLNVKEAVEAANRIGAAHTYFVGMSHSLFYDDMPDRITYFGGDADRMELGWDGCVVFEQSGTATPSTNR